MIRVCIADDQALIRSGLAALIDLAGGFTITALAADGEAAVEAVLADPPDVLLLDVRMPRLDGIGVLRALAAQAALPPTLLLTTFDDDAALVAGVRAGARGYLLKGVTAETLFDAIRTVAAGHTYLAVPPAPNLTPPTGGWRDEAFADPDELTPREREILALMSNGLSNREIADALRLSEGTVRNHVSNILSKLGVGDRTRAVLYAIEKNMV